MAKKEIKKDRGVFVRPSGSEIWWICYCDQYGRKHREMMGLCQTAISAYQKLKTEVREGRFFPGVQQIPSKR